MGDTQAAQAGAFAGDTDEELLSYMALRPDHEDGARAAGDEFFTRHRGFLYKTLRHASLARRYSDEDLVDLVQETFLTAYLEADGYRSCGSHEPEPQRRACRAWLVGIAKNILRNWRSGNISIIAEASSFEDLAAVLDVETVAATGSEREVARALEREFEKLTEREQDVVLETMLYHKPGESHQRLPNAASRDLADAWGTTAANIRRIRKVAFDKLRSGVEDELPPPSKEER